MLKRPYCLSLYAILMIFAANLTIFEAILSWETEKLEFLMIWANLGYLTQAVVILCFVNASLSLSANRILIFTAPVSFLLFGWNNLLVSGNDFYLTQHPALNFFSMDSEGFGPAFLSSAGFLIIQTLLLSPEAVRAFDLPHMRWWLHAKRLPVKIPVVLNVGDGKYNLVSHDLSSTGVYVTAEDVALAPEIFSSEHFTENDPVEITLSARSASSIKVKGEIVRLQKKSLGSYPDGLGIRFETLSLAQKLKLEFNLVYFSLLSKLRIG